MSTEKKALLEVKHLKKYFEIGKNQTLKAVDDVSLEVLRGETFGLVGESGCGKSTFGRTVIRLYEPTTGHVLYDGQVIDSALSHEKRRQFSRKMQMIFQDPYASLNPRMKVMDIIAEGMDAHGLYSGKEREEKVLELLKTVGLSKEHANRFPHEFSGGQRQRVGIARALAVDPEFIICDEPISALDVSIQAQVINLLKELQEKRGLTYLFIAHDLSMVKHISDRIGVMYLGGLVELAESEELFEDPLHPYTQALLSAIPIPDPDEEKGRTRIMLEGSLPNPISLEGGCRFASRCPYAKEICRHSLPEWKEIKPGHYAACHKVG
ncbi:oligopeptide/dipeptide ABC transporter ATP-binding protein [Clostridium sp. HBUAS56010]|uniref:ABC transporter ATP-binding protein n=1 Tax=Clostridium sp. HBUAS56010 TaxID=2571127 RepID=UPI0011781290|nr:oligopeptide/dipeptide ABC transporter ATP-binding protein [Clostridium sp. HBUAS56010]